MKFKFLGENNSYCLELMAFGLEKKDEYLQKGQIINVPDSNKVVIDALDHNGLFVRVNQSSKPKKVDKKENK